jgi:hypothetical protein
MNCLVSSAISQLINCREADQHPPPTVEQFEAVIQRPRAIDGIDPRFSEHLGLCVFAPITPYKAPWDAMNDWEQSAYLHMQKIPDGPMYQCPVKSYRGSAILPCPATLAGDTAVRHLTDCHAGAFNIDGTCIFCGKTPDSLTGYAHSSKCPSLAETDCYFCAVCHQVFVTIKALRKHWNSDSHFRGGGNIGALPVGFRATREGIARRKDARRRAAQMHG